MWHRGCHLRARPLPNPTQHTLTPLSPVLLTYFCPAELLCFPLPMLQALSCSQSSFMSQKDRTVLSLQAWAQSWGSCCLTALLPTLPSDELTLFQASTRATL